MKSKPTFIGYIAGQYSLDGVYVYRNRKEHTMFKEKNIVKFRIVVRIFIISILVISSLLEFFGVNLELLATILLTSALILFCYTHLRYFFIDFIEIKSKEEAEDTRFKVIERVFDGLLIIVIVLFFVQLAFD